MVKPWLNHHFSPVWFAEIPTCLLWDATNTPPQALEAARTYGFERCELDPQVLEEWEMRLGRIMKAATPTDVDVKGKFQFRSPLKRNYVRRGRSSARTRRST